MRNKILLGISAVGTALMGFVQVAHGAVTQWNATDTASVVDPIVTAVHDNLIYLAVTIGPYAVALGIAFLVWRWFQHKARNPG